MMNDLLQLLAIIIFTALSTYAMSDWGKYWRQEDDGVNDDKY
ncbi:hypothetical protein [Streptococcus suis]|nr:hypothetical protein [Streptococcus suis]